MLDDIFNNKCYDDLFRRVFQFQEYGDMANFWLEFDYYITRDRFVSRLGESLDTNIRSFSGEKILRDAADAETIASRPYKVVNETIEPQGDWQDIYKVTELYGYAPSNSYENFGCEIVQRFGTEDLSGQTTQQCYDGNRSTYDAGLDIFWIDMDTRISNFNVGDIVNCIGIGHVTYTTFYNFSSPKVSIEAIDGKKMKVRAFEITYGTSGYTTGKQDTINLINRLGTWSGTVYMHRLFFARAPRNRLVNVRSIITYHDSLPSIVEKFVPIDGTGAEVDTITSVTTPTIAEWKERIAANDEYVVQDSEIESVYTLYKRTVKRTTCR